MTMANRQHDPGDDSVAESTPKKQKDGTWVLRWRFWPYNGKSALIKRSQAPTKGEVIRRARAAADELRKSGGDHGAWSKATPVTQYVEQVSVPAVKDNTRLKQNSIDRYLIVLDLLVGKCGHEDHKHTDSLDGYVVADLAKFRNLKACIVDIAATHGAETARQARNILSKYVIKKLIEDDVLDGNPLAGMDIDYGTLKASHKPSGGHALSEGDYDRVVAWLLDLDPAEGVTPPKRGVYTLADRVAKRRNLINTTLLQATTGMRVSETGTVEPEEVIDNKQGGVNIYIPITKTDVPRTVTILNPRVADRFRSLRDSTAPGEYVISSPADKAKKWNKDNRGHALADFYKEVSAELGIPEMKTSFRSHGWRTTLNMIYFYLPDHIRALWFGHGVDVNHSNYTDPTVDLSVMVDAADTRRGASERAGEAVEESADGDRESA